MDQINVAVSAVSTAVRETVPMWLNSLPIPDTLAGYAELSGAQWMRLTPLFLAVLAHVIVLLHFFTKSASPRVNTQIDLKSELVKQEIVMEGEKMAFCRCWKSAKFPFCDGSHRAHNAATGDNVGPVVVMKTAPKKTE